MWLQLITGDLNGFQGKFVQDQSVGNHQGPANKTQEHHLLRDNCVFKEFFKEFNKKPCNCEVSFSDFSIGVDGGDDSLFKPIKDQTLVTQQLCWFCFVLLPARLCFFFPSLLSCKIKDQLSQNFHRFVILCLC